MDPQSINEIMEWAVALKQAAAREIALKDQEIATLREEIKNTKITSKPIKDQKQ